MDKKEIGRKISAIRKEHGMTQKELAEKLHVTDKSVSKWETGTHFPDIAIMEDLAIALGISVAELLGLENVSSEELISEITKISLEEKEEIKKALRFRMKLNMVTTIVLAVFEVYFFWFLHDNGLQGLEYRVFTIGLLGAIGGLFSNAFTTFKEIKDL